MDSDICAYFRLLVAVLGFSVVMATPGFSRITAINMKGERISGGLDKLTPRKIAIQNKTFTMNLNLTALRSIWFQKPDDSLQISPNTIVTTESKRISFRDLLTVKSNKLRYESLEGENRSIAVENVRAVFLSGGSNSESVWIYENERGDTIRITHNPDTVWNFRSGDLKWSTQREDHTVRMNLRGKDSEYSLWKFPYSEEKSWKLVQTDPSLRMEWTASHRKDWKGYAEHVLEFKLSRSGTVLIHGELAPGQGGPIEVTARLSNDVNESWELRRRLSEKPTSIGVLPVFIDKFLDAIGKSEEPVLR